MVWLDCKIKRSGHIGSGEETACKWLSTCLLSASAYSIPFYIYSIPTYSIPTNPFYCHLIFSLYLPSAINTTTSYNPTPNSIWLVRSYAAVINLLKGEQKDCKKAECEQFIFTENIFLKLGFSVLPGAMV